MAAVSVSNVSKRFGSHVAVEDISFDLDAGETVAVFGSNGAGKTTLVRMLSSLSRPTEGRIEVGGDTVHETAAVRGQIGLVAHETMLYDDLTARENLRLHARLHGVDQSVCDSLLQEVGLATRGSERVGDFSHGMAKRVALARALVHDPDFLVLDEPYSGLDQQSLARVTETLSQLADRTVLAATHDLERGVRLAERVFFMNRGRLVGTAPVSSADDVEVILEQYEQWCRGKPLVDGEMESE